MATNGLRRTLDRLRNTLAPGDLTDEQLLQRFLAERSEVAFAGLVRRHGALVLGVSRRVLGNVHDSEDVFQATFLVLAQKAALVVHREALASWLYKVAYRIALKARARNERRRKLEKQVEVMPHPETQTPALQDWEVLLDEEMTRLPEKYRIPVILCDLEGRTGKEVERRLRLAPGTLSSRLTMARRMLAERLTRRGLTLSGGALAMAISEAAAAVPSRLVGTTAQQAVLVAAGQLAAISGSVTILMKAGVKAMFLAKLKATVATLMVVAVLGGGLVYSGGGQAKAPNELDALRKENELLKVNLRVTLEKIQALESQVAVLKGRKNEGADATKLKALLEDDMFRRQQAIEPKVAERDLKAAQAELRAVEANMARAEHMARLKQHEIDVILTRELEEKNRLHHIQGLDAVLKDLQKTGGSQRAVEALDLALKVLRAQEKKAPVPRP